MTSMGHFAKVIACIGLVFLSAAILSEKGYVPFPGGGRRMLAPMMQEEFQSPTQKRKAAAYAQYLYGLLYEHRGRFDMAVKKFRAAKAQDPQGILPRIHLAVNLVHAGRKEDASKEFEQASLLNPGDPKVKTVTALLFA